MCGLGLKQKQVLFHNSILKDDENNMAINKERVVVINPLKMLTDWQFFQFLCTFTELLHHFVNRRWLISENSAFNF